MSSIIGSFLAVICAAICCCTFAPETPAGNALMTISPSSTSHLARWRIVPLPLLYISRISASGVMISPSVAKSGPLMCLVSWAMVRSGLSSRSMQAATTSRTLCDGMSVAMPTAMPEAPLSSTCGSREGSSFGSFIVPSKFWPQSVVPCSNSESSDCANLVIFDSV